MTRKPTPTERPYDPPRGKYVRLKFDDLIRILAMVEHHGQSRKLMGKTSAIETSVRVPSDAARAVKELVARHPEMRSSSLGKRVLFARKKTRAAAVALSARSVVARETPTVARSAGSVATGNDYCCGFGPGG
jgi:hypothetical protein